MQETEILQRPIQIDIEATTNLKYISKREKNRARGVCILISKDTKEILEHQVPVSLKGNLIQLRFKIKKIYYILNIYGQANFTRPHTDFYK